MISTLNTLNLSSMNSLNLNKRCIDRLVREYDDSNDDSCYNNRKNKARRLNTDENVSSSSPNTTTTNTRTSKTLLRVVSAESTTRLTASSSLSSSFSTANALFPVLSPATYMTMSLKNKKIEPIRIDPFSLEQALYFEPYQESDIDFVLLKAVRTSNLGQLRSLLYQDDNFNNDLFHKRNNFGENLLHIACRMGLSFKIVKFLVEEAQIPLNVRDKCGRTPLHTACMTSLPNFDNLQFLLMEAPKQVVMEDDNSKLPFELIPSRTYHRWTRFLSEKNILQLVSNQLIKLMMTTKTNHLLHQLDEATK